MGNGKTTEHDETFVLDEDDIESLEDLSLSMLIDEAAAATGKRRGHERPESAGSGAESADGLDLLEDRESSD